MSLCVGFGPHVTLCCVWMLLVSREVDDPWFEYEALAGVTPTDLVAHGGRFTYFRPETEEIVQARELKEAEVWLLGGAHSR